MRRLLLVPAVWVALSAAPVDFTREVEPILQKRCIACHGVQQQMNGLRLDQRDAALAGGYSGTVITAGKSSASRLIERVTSAKPGFAMPPLGPKLTAPEIATLRAWIDEGAKWPAAATVAAPRRSNHWSFQPVRREEPPDVRNRAWMRNPIDAFVLAKLDALGIEPSPEADRNTLIRRLSLDLTGLPPEPAAVAAFLGDNRADAYERLVDTLLASPHYGEKWARQWLDLAHYADSDGYEKDQVRPHSWRFRHWVIDALNRDMPFDQFTIEQIAGDLVPNAGVEQRVATGFLRNTLTNREAGVDRAEARFEQTVNRTNTAAEVWLGLTVGCAQCHDHKYDPISQKEYYQMFSFFDRTEEADIDAPLAGEIGPWMQARPEYERKREEILAKFGIAELQPQWESRIHEAMSTPGKNLEWDFSVTSFRAMVDGGEKMLRTDPAKRTVRQRERLTNYFVGSPGPDFPRDKEKQARLKEARAALSALDSAFAQLSQAPTMTEDAGAPKTRMAVRGDYRQKGIEVEPGTVAVLPALGGAGVPPRLALARWLVSRDNPLTARVFVNRAWQELFGRGLVRTSNDFGTQGEKPTHPELLDWLAAEFPARAWSMKQLHRLMVTSATYRQSSRARSELAARDPENALLARQSRLRLPAELIRDGALAASGLLNPVIGGKSVRPPLPAGVAELGYSNSVKWRDSTGPDRYRRGLYIHFQRTTPYPQLMNFDAPDSNVTCSRRRTSNTPLQSLNLLNDPVFFEAAQALAARVLREAPPAFGDRLDYAFAISLARKPATRERERLAAYYDQQAQLLRRDSSSAALLLPVRPEGIDAAEAAAWVGVSRVLLNLDEFLTRE